MGNYFWSRTMSSFLIQIEKLVINYHWYTETLIKLVFTTSLTVYLIFINRYRAWQPIHTHILRWGKLDSAGTKVRIREVDKKRIKISRIYYVITYFYVNWSYQILSLFIQWWPAEINKLSFLIYYCKITNKNATNIVKILYKYKFEGQGEVQQNIGLVVGWWISASLVVIQLPES